MPVSPACNIGCRFCSRVLNDTENRPGVTAKVIKPEESIAILRKALKICPDIKVVGIAGPGDTLATDTALETFRLVDKEFPHLLKCMSTNGLLLDEKADQVIASKIDSLTVTVNAIDPEIEAKLNKFVLYHGKKYDAYEGAKILIENQLNGIRKVAKSGITVKVNTVLVPRINGSHIEQIAKTVSSLGASIYNIIPLIPTYELKDEKAPFCFEIEEARKSAGKYIDVFRHCNRCRADAVGVPGVSEFSKEVYSEDFVVSDTFSHG
ncbi:MAG: radical SAM protein [Paludibacteraceae bacterium]|nr:radical SAM protein [Paludibacteraceae bacterium]MBO7506009.1 radical SAM protein [Paludibacteraceae bacterium]MBO7606971.1 radical SAM protein [Paludibacteraceae bacterium]